MRGLLLSLAFMTALGMAAPQAAPAPLVSTSHSISALMTSFDQDQPTKNVNVDINVNRGGGRWYANPVWIAIGSIAAVIVLLLIVMIARGGGGTTIVHD
jgi:hypothetical protein